MKLNKTKLINILFIIAGVLIVYMGFEMREIWLILMGGFIVGFMIVLID